MSSDNVRVRVKVGANEVEIEGPRDSLKELIELVPAMVEGMASAKPSSIPPTVEQVQAPATVQAQQAPLQDLPELRVEKGESLPSIMTKLFGSSWGRTPRRLLEVKGALESFGLVYPRQSVAVALLRLAQEGKLRRFKGPDGDFLYTSSTSLMQSGSEYQQAARQEPLQEPSISDASIAGP
jgi:hypothetical protein